MRVFQLKADVSRFQTLVVSDDNEVSRLRLFSREEPITEWKPLLVEVPEENQDSPTSDFPSIGGTVPVFSERAVNALQDQLDGRGQLLPLKCKGANYFALKVSRIVDALDSTRSEFERYSDGTIMEVTRYMFSPARLRGETVFKLPRSVEKVRVYITDSFMQCVHDARLVGFKCPLLWEG